MGRQVLGAPGRHRRVREGVDVLDAGGGVGRGRRVAEGGRLDAQRG